MAEPCARCADLDADQVDQLEVVGGSDNPCSDPYGELRRCGACGAWFCYTRDHDNEIGYVAASPTLGRLDRARAHALATKAAVVARRQLDHFEQAQDDYGRRCAADYTAELARLSEAVAALAPPASEPCVKCGHDFGKHQLRGYGQPPIEGWMVCPAEGCACYRTWSGPGGSAEGGEAAYQRYLAERDAPTE